MEKPHRGNGPLLALLIVLTLCLLLVATQYSFKHDLPATRALRALLTRRAPDTATAATTPPVATPGADAGDDGVTVPPAPFVSYDAYLRDTLLPAYGQADADAVASALAAEYAFPDGADATGATGLCCAEIVDLDGDETDELVVLRIRQDGDRFPLELHIYGVQDGMITEMPDATVTIKQLAGAPAGQRDSLELVWDNDTCYLLLHTYSESETAFLDRYVAYDITAAKTTLALDGVFSSTGGSLLLVGTVPPWLDASAVTSVQRVTDPASGLNGHPIYADNAGASLYDSPLTALNAMLGPLVNVERVTLLDPLHRDWTGLSALLSGEDAAEDGGDGFVDYDDFDSLDDLADLANEAASTDDAALSEPAQANVDTDE